MEETKEERPLSDNDLEENQDNLETERPPAKDTKRDSDVLETDLLEQIIQEYPSLNGNNSPTKKDHKESEEFFKADKSRKEEKEIENDELRASHDDIEKQWKELGEEM